jgi:phenylacetate-CoA ligase
MCLGGEGSSNALRKRVEALWGCPCLRYYSSLECGPIGIECPFQDGLHVPENYSIVEIIDPVTGEALPDRTVGEVCITVLYRFGAPFIRYRMQDVGMIDRSPCRCCLERPRIFLKGRPTERIGSRGRTFSPFEVEEHLFRMQEMGNNYSFTVTGETVSLTAEVARGYDHAVLRRRLRDVLGDYPIAEIAIVDQIPRTYGKAVRVKHQAA